jgi:hypothetical protein
MIYRRTAPHDVAADEAANGRAAKFQMNRDRHPSAAPELFLFYT